MGEKKVKGGPFYRIQNGEEKGETGLLHLPQKGKGQVEIGDRGEIPSDGILQQRPLGQQKIPPDPMGKGKAVKEAHYALPLWIRASFSSRVRAFTASSRRRAEGLSGSSS